MEIVVAIVVCVLLLFVAFFLLKMMKMLVRVVVLAVFGGVVLVFLLTYGRPMLELGAQKLRAFAGTASAPSSSTAPRKPSR